ncbi:serine/threonine-protein kinase [Planctomycetaceae bacterium SH139]
MTDFETLGPYRVEAKLGQGGMGSVYRGVHIKTGQRVAIKVLASQMSEQPRFRRRFAGEIETLKKLRHPNIVRLIGHGEERGALFYAMDLVEGPSLLEHLRKVKRLDWDTTIGFAIEICSALKHAHDFGVIHRDLKPANLLLEPEGGIKLTDFGIAKLFGATEHTAAGSVLGTADYMAPEQAVGGQVTPRTDLYALGSLMYACLAGRPPFGGRNLTQVVYGLKHETPAPLDLVLPDVPEELAELVHELLEKDPKQRPPTALVVSKRLQAMRAGLRHRGEQTAMNLGGLTLPESPESAVHTRLPERPSPARDMNVANLPTADDRDSGVPTGTPVKLANTLASVDPAGQEFELAEEIAAPRTHFESVNETPQRTGHWEAGESHRSGLEHWLSLFGLVLALIVVGGLVIWLFQTPSAESMLAKIEQADSLGDRREAELLREQFLRSHEDHPQAEAVRETLQLDDVEKAARRLRVVAATGGGIDSLPPAEQVWLQAMTERKRDPSRAARSLTQWLAIYDHREAFVGGPGDKELARYVALAKAELERLESFSTFEPDSRQERLQAWITWGSESLEGDARQQFLKSVKALYGDKPWAEEIIEKLPD